MCIPKQDNKVVVLLLTQLLLLSKRGQPLQGIDAALTLVKKSPNFNAREFDQLKVFVEIVRVRSRSARYDWQSGDPTVPEGWKSRSSGSKKFFLSPDGQSFPCRFQTLPISQFITDID